MQPLVLDTGTTVMVSYVTPGELGEPGEIHFKHRGAFVERLEELRNILSTFRGVEEVSFNEKFWVLKTRTADVKGTCLAIVQAIITVFPTSPRNEATEIVVQQDDSVSVTPSATPSVSRKRGPRTRQFVNDPRRR